MKDNPSTEPGGSDDLALLQTLPVAAADGLRARWITTIEQLVASTALPTGRDGLSRLLAPYRISPDTVIEEARRLVGRGDVDRLLQSRPGGELGARIKGASDNVVPKRKGKADDMHAEGDRP